MWNYTWIQSVLSPWLFFKENAHERNDREKQGRAWTSKTSGITAWTFQMGTNPSLLQSCFSPPCWILWFHLHFSISSTPVLFPTYHISFLYTFYLSNQFKSTVFKHAFTTKWMWLSVFFSGILTLYLIADMFASWYYYYYYYYILPSSVNKYDSVLFLLEEQYFDSFFCLFPQYHPNQGFTGTTHCSVSFTGICWYFTLA